MCFWVKKKREYRITFRKRLILNSDKSGYDEVKDDVLLFHWRRVEEKMPVELKSIRFISSPGVCKIEFLADKKYADEIFMDFVERTKAYIHDIHFERV
jgi:hypothetical protein